LAETSTTRMRRKKDMMNPELKKTIRVLRAASKKSDQAIWATIADHLDRAKRKRYAVNLSRFNRNTQAGETVAVPGKVLASGSLDHPVTVAAYSFSDIAVEKIALAGGRAVSLEGLLEEGVAPRQIRILK
jgi:large subunit ribosomal protein L18e